MERILKGGAPALIRVYGRRRLGKTELLQELARRLGGTYLLVDESDTPVVLDSLARQLAAAQVTLRAPLRNWDDLFTQIGRMDTAFVVLDEFQRLVQADRAAISRLQGHWDSSLSKTGPSIILCGSSVGMMQRITRTGSAPLFGRLSGDLRLRAFDYASVRLLYPDLAEDDRIRRYAVFGGTPHYHRHSVGASLEKAVMDSFLQPAAPFQDEPQTLLRLELQAPTRYNSILYEVGHGTHSLPDLERKAGVKAGGLGPYLRLLREDLDLLRKDDPVAGVQKRARYVFQDPFFDFFYRFVYGERPQIELGRGEEVWQRIEAHLDAYVGRHFEAVVHQALLAAHGTMQGGVRIQVDKVGRWWSRKGEEIDVVAIGPEEVIVGEVKWSRQAVGADDIHLLLDRSTLLERTNDRPIRPLIVARGGLTQGAAAAAKEEHALVWGVEDVARIFDAVRR